MLLQCYEATNNETGWLKYLRQCVEQKAGATAELMLADEISKHEGSVTAQMFMTRQLTKNPTMKGFYQLMDYHLDEAEDGRGKRELDDSTLSCRGGAIEDKAAFSLSEVWICHAFFILAVSIV